MKHYTKRFLATITLLFGISTTMGAAASASEIIVWVQGTQQTSLQWIVIAETSEAEQIEKVNISKIQKTSATDTVAAGLMFKYEIPVGATRICVMTKGFKLVPATAMLAMLDGSTVNSDEVGPVSCSQWRSDANKAKYFILMAN